jgi:LPXTG-motif cell wall-anchored protein
VHHGSTTSTSIGTLGSTVSTTPGGGTVLGSGFDSTNGTGSGSLPKTGSSSTLPALGIGIVLIGTGIGLALGRRRRVG